VTYLCCLQPKVQNHTYSCSASGFNCIDCGRTFDRHTVKVLLSRPLNLYGTQRFPMIGIKSLAVHGIECQHVPASNAQGQVLQCAGAHDMCDGA
jgi:hypothetical protein